MVSEETAPSVFQLYNHSGAVILEEKIQSERQTIDAAFLPAGMYFYRLTNENGKAVTGKLLKN
ncbi:MAG TPA: T9SS type A sorting domain-containing protein [Bacteroidia bacterium]|nr:T9SS type A sorting domain-containing protein [Bacteroidia bacterium]